MKRSDNWESKLFSFLKNRSTLPMEWGKTDCFLLAVDSLQVITGVDCDQLDPKNPFRGKYRTMRSAYRILKRYPGRDVSGMFQFFANILRLPVVSYAFAGRGDIALLNVESEIGGVREVIGVVTGRDIAVQGKSGLLNVQLNQAKKVWKV